MTTNNLFMVDSLDECFDSNGCGLKGKKEFSWMTKKRIYRVATSSPTNLKKDDLLHVLSKFGDKALHCKVVNWNNDIFSGRVHRHEIGTVILAHRRITMNSDSGAIPLLTVISISSR